MPSRSVRKEVDVGSDYLWYLPTHGDGRDLLGSAHHVEASVRKARPPTLAYLKQVALAAEHAGFNGVLIPAP